MGTQSTVYIEREEAVKLLKKRLKERGWWKEVKSYVKHRNNKILGDMLDRVIDSSFDNFIVFEGELHDEDNTIETSSFSGGGHGFYIPLTKQDLIDWT